MQEPRVLTIKLPAAGGSPVDPGPGRASRRCRRGRSKPSTARWRSGCAAGSSARPASASAMSSSYIPLATATAAPATRRWRCRLWWSPIWRWCARRARPARPTPNGTAGTATSLGGLARRPPGAARPDRGGIGALGAAGRRRGRAAACARSGSDWPSACPARRGTRSWCSNATSCCTKPGWFPRRGAISAAPPCAESA